MAADLMAEANASDQLLIQHSAEQDDWKGIAAALMAEVNASDQLLVQHSAEQDDWKGIAAALMAEVNASDQLLVQHSAEQDGWKVIAADLMAEVDASDELLEEPQGRLFRQALLAMLGLMPVNVICQITSSCKLADYGQVLGGQEHLPELDDVGVVEAEPLIENLPRRYLHTASGDKQRWVQGSKCVAKLQNLEWWCEACDLQSHSN